MIIVACQFQWNAIYLFFRRLQYFDEDRNLFRFSINNIPDDLLRKVTLLNYFGNYMEKHLLKVMYDFYFNINFWHAGHCLQIVQEKLRHACDISIPSPYWGFNLIFEAFLVILRVLFPTEIRTWLDRSYFFKLLKGSKERAVHKKFPPCTLGIL